LDSEFARYRANKAACRAERFGKYVCHQDFDPQTAEAAVRLMVNRAATEYPEHYTRETTDAGPTILHSHLTNEQIPLDANARLASPVADYRDAFDALCCQVQEDIAIVRRTPDGADKVVALHLCSPSFWGAEEKIGQNFIVTHAPVPAFGKVAAAATALVDSCIRRGPFVRFTWGIAFSDRLNQHPEPPPGLPNALEQRADFDPTNDPLWFRIERQVLWGLPEVDAFLFTIRVFLYDARETAAHPENGPALRAALTSMSPEARRYKGLTEVFDRVMKAVSIEC
jgi:dimethylamine monooxygenase subunit A